MTTKQASKKTADKPKTAATPKPSATKAKAPITLAVDIGGTGLKMMLLDAAGKPITERARVKTPDNPTPKRIIATLDALRKTLPPFERVSVGFPGVIKGGATLTAVNLHPLWVNFPLESTLVKLWKKPVRVANDAAVQGYGAIKGKGVEMVITLGTGMGSALYTGGRLCPGLELAHHPWRNKTYEDYLGKAGLKHHGKKRWNKLVQEAIAQTAKTFNWDTLYIGGGNAKFIELTLGKGVEIISNEEGLLGGAALWHD